MIYEDVDHTGNVIMGETGIIYTKPMTGELKLFPVRP